MAVLPPLKVRRHIPTILAIILLFTKDIKEVHTIERHSLIDREVTNFSYGRIISQTLVYLCSSSSSSIMGVVLTIVSIGMDVDGALVGGQSALMLRSPSTEPEMPVMSATRSLAHLIDFLRD